MSYAITEDLEYLRLLMVNVYLFGPTGAGDRGWVLVDAGLAGTAALIARAAEERFGKVARPSGIVLTHGHFDHVGALRALAERWDAPVYAHPLELPYLAGRSAYPPPDPTVGGGAVAALSGLYPRGPVDLGDRLRILPIDGSVPGMPGWRWIHTPGHSPGHVSLFRDSDRLLIAGDAFVTTKQESAISVLLQWPELHGPPSYFTPDWESARRSVEELAALEPSIAATGHGRPLRGGRMRQELRALARDFERAAVPAYGRYFHCPAVTDEDGVVSVPPPVDRGRTPGVLVGLGAAIAIGGALGVLRGRRDERGRSRSTRLARSAHS